MSLEQIKATDFSNMPMLDLVKAAKEGVAEIARDWDLRKMALKDSSYFGNTGVERKYGNPVDQAMSAVDFVWKISENESVSAFLKRVKNLIKISSGFFLAGAGPFISIDPFAGTRVAWSGDRAYVDGWVNRFSSPEANRPMVWGPYRITMGRINGIWITPTRGLFEHLMENHQQRVVNDLANLTPEKIISSVSKGIKSPSRVQISIR